MFFMLYFTDFDNMLILNQKKELDYKNYKEARL